MFEELEFVRNIFARNRLMNPMFPTGIDQEDFIGLEYTQPEKEMTEMTFDFSKQKIKSYTLVSDCVDFVPAYVNKSGKQIKGYFRTKKVK